MSTLTTGVQGQPGLETLSQSKSGSASHVFSLAIGPLHHCVSVSVLYIYYVSVCICVVYLCTFPTLAPQYCCVSLHPPILKPRVLSTLPPTLAGGVDS